MKNEIIEIEKLLDFIFCHLSFQFLFKSQAITILKTIISETNTEIHKKKPNKTNKYSTKLCL